MNRAGVDTVDLSAPGDAGADHVALRALLARLKDHLAAAEARAGSEFERLGAKLERAADSPDGGATEGLYALARNVLDGQRGAACELMRLSDELRGMADGLEARLVRSGQARVAALRAMEREVRGLGERLEARLGEAEAQTRAAFGLLSERLARWEAASDARQARAAADFSAQLDESEAQRERDIGELLSAMQYRQVEPAGAVGTSAQRRGPGRPSRSAALLLSAGVACLGLVTLAVVLEPPRSAALKREAPAFDLVLRGPILTAPPREAPVVGSGAPSEGAVRAPTPGAAAGSFAAAVSAVEAGRPGAVEQLRVIAEAGQPRAQMYLAKLYELGKAGLTVDPVQARRWTARAAEAGSPVAMHNLALYYLQGRGGPLDDAAAARLFRRAAGAGLADSQFNLGLLYETGSGVDRNLIEAYKWFQIAANGGDLKARARAVALEDRLSAKELASAERVVNRFTPETGNPEETVLVPGAATIAEAQRKLAREGYYIGPTDGQDSPAYREAVEAFRRNQAARATSPGSTAS